MWIGSQQELDLCIKMALTLTQRETLQSVYFHWLRQETTRDTWPQSREKLMGSKGELCIYTLNNCMEEPFPHCLPTHGMSNPMSKRVLMAEK